MTLFGKSNPIFLNAPLVALTVTVSVALEAFGWGYIWMTNTARSSILGFSVPLALVESIIISATGLVALVAAFVAAERRNDPRISERRKARAAQILALVLLGPGIVKAADSFAYPGQLAKAEAYAASEQYQTDLTNSRDHSLDSATVRDAATALGQAIRPARAQFDFGAWAWSAFLYIANSLAASCLWRVKPETATERQRREKESRARKARATREANKAAKLAAEATNRPSWLRGIFERKVG